MCGEGRLAGAICMWLRCGDDEPRPSTISGDWRSKVKLPANAHTLSGENRAAKTRTRRRAEVGRRAATRGGVAGRNVRRHLQLLVLVLLVVMLLLLMVLLRGGLAIRRRRRVTGRRERSHAFRRCERLVSDLSQAHWSHHRRNHRTRGADSDRRHATERELQTRSASDKRVEHVRKHALGWPGGERNEPRDENCGDG